MTEISVIIPVYNIGKYLRKCVFSVLDQDNSSVEIILVDDGSTDQSGMICDRFREKYSNVVVIHQKNGGLPRARNEGIRRATGNYLLFLDGDDFLLKGSLNRILDMIRNHSGTDVFIGRYISYYEDAKKKESCGYCLDGERIVKAAGEELIYEVVRDKTYNWYSWLNIVRRAYLLEHNLYFDEGRKYFEDAVWTPRLLYEAKDVRYIEEPFYVYVQNRAGSITTKIDEEAYRHRMAGCRFANSFAEKNKLRETVAKAFLSSYSPMYVSLLADCWYLDAASRRKYLAELSKNRHFLRFSFRGYQRLLYRLSLLSGLTAVSYVLYLRARWVRRKR